MTQIEKAKRFAALHINGKPVVLYNAWDAGSAKAIADAGSPAVATSSWSVAAAHGYWDGEDIPVAFLEEIVGRIVMNVEVPVTVDFEGGYSDNDDELAINFHRLMKRGVVGINFEDRIVKGEGLYRVDHQARRIGVLRRTAEVSNLPLFINARTDVFLQSANHEASLPEVIARAEAYRAAGASGLFAPGLIDDALIRQLVERVALPVNVMVMEGLSPVPRLSELGVARVSFGPIPFVETMKALSAQTSKAISA